MIKPYHPKPPKPPRNRLVSSDDNVALFASGAFALALFCTPLLASYATESSFRLKDVDDVPGARVCFMESAGAEYRLVVRTGVPCPRTCEVPRRAD